MSAVLHRPLRLPAVSRDTLGARNVLCRHRVPMQAQWLDEAWRFEIDGRVGDAPPEYFVECDWGGARVFVGIDRAPLALLANLAMPGGDPFEWPLPVLLAALEYAASELAGGVEAATRKSVQVLSVTTRPDAEGFESCAWRARSEQRDIAGTLLLDATASRFLAAALRTQPIARGELDFGELPVRLRLVAGWVDLAAGALRGLATRDVVLLDECLVAQGNRLLAQIGPRLGVPCELDGTVLKVLDEVEEIMSDIDDGMDAASGLLDDVPVRLTFDLGEREVSLADLRSLQPGYLFNLGRDPRSTVSIRANGRLIGEGELVDIEGRVGVSVLSFNLEGR